MEFNEIEREIILLKAIKTLIDEMVNWELVKLVGEEPHFNIVFHSAVHQKLFNILLVDFLSPPDGKFIKSQSYLSALEKVCASPNFDVDNSITTLARATQEFSDWLEKEVPVGKVWLPAINLEIDLSIKRIEFIEICGNISKHNFTRLYRGVVKDLKEVFKRNNKPLEDEDALLIIDEFYQWFHDNIFSYHSSAIAEFLNNIRWGIYEYLQPEFHCSLVIDDDKDLVRYHYTYPDGLSNRFAKACYWNLMNDIRSEPFMKKFQVTKYLKMRY